MKKSITRQIFIIFLGFVIVLFILSGIAIRFFLPNYYREQKINELEYYSDSIIEAKDKGADAEEVSLLFDRMRQNIGGEIYLIDSSGQTMGMFRQGMGRNRPMPDHNYAWEDGVLKETYENKLGVRIYAFCLLYTSPSPRD